MVTEIGAGGTFFHKTTMSLCVGPAGSENMSLNELFRSAGYCYIIVPAQGRIIQPLNFLSQHNFKLCCICCSSGVGCWNPLRAYIYSTFNLLSVIRLQIDNTFALQHVSV